MHAASSVLQKCLSGVTDSMHVYRLRALLGSVQCLLSLSASDPDGHGAQLAGCAARTGAAEAPGSLAE